MRRGRSDAAAMIATLRRRVLVVGASGRIGELVAEERRDGPASRIRLLRGGVDTY